LESKKRDYVDHIARMDKADDQQYEPRDFAMEIPPRRYQRVAAEKYLECKSMLVGDDVGLGKTCTAICSFTDPDTLPALVVCMPHLQKQWQREIADFIPKCRTHVIKQRKAYEIPESDVYITTYHKLTSWRPWIMKECRSVVFDEVQELRRSKSQKYKAAFAIASAMKYRIGLSATPIFNYGDEMFNVLDLLKKGCLGTHAEFVRAWCSGGYVDKIRVTDPRSFGAYLRRNHLMIRRTRNDVGRELPAQSRVLQFVSSDTKPLEDAKTAASELANLILNGTKEQSFSSAGQFDMLMRQVTGIAKAPHVAEFVRMIVKSDEKVVLFGWHRAVYDIWMESLSEFNPVMYTGSESTKQKSDALEAFVSGDSKVLIVSLRSGAGVDGLQHVCKTVVFGEFDWSPSVHEQNIGRVARDGQEHPVFAYYLACSDGSDPFMIESLGIKKDQLTGIRSPETGRDDSDFAAPKMAAKSMKKLAAKMFPELKEMK